MSDWDSATDWEGDWWGNCCSTLGEELKQLVYARKMGLKYSPNNKTPYNFDLENKSVLDIGGGPVSILLKCTNVKGTVIDPCDYPLWVAERYKLAGIEYIKQKGEDLDTSKRYDEVWIYNVLQHTEDPEKIIKSAMQVSKIIRIFEWINTLTNIGHPHTFTENQLNAWLWGMGKTEILNESGCNGQCFYGIFKGKNYAG